MDDVEFTDLVARAKAGDEGAIPLLLRHFEDDVRIMVRVRLPRLLRSQFDSLDFVQAVWQSFWLRFGEDPTYFEGPQHLRQFLAGVVRNKVMEEYRRQSRARKYELEHQELFPIRRGDSDGVPEPIAHDATPSQNVQAADCWERLVGGRNPREAEVIALRREGLTIDVIAERLGMNPRSVRRLLETLRKRVEDQP